MSRNITGTVLVAVNLANERAVFTHWALSVDFWAISLAPRSSLPNELPTDSAVLLFDQNWGHDLRVACSCALSRGIAPVAVIGPEHGWSPEAILTARCTDFLRRPYEPDDAFARIGRALRLSSTYTCETTPESREVFKLGELSICGTTRKASFRGRTVTLRRAECNVMTRLAKAFPNPVSQSEIVEHVLGASGNGATARNQVYEIRRKFASIGAYGIVKTLRGAGAYQLDLVGGSCVNANEVTSR